MTVLTGLLRRHLTPSILPAASTPQPEQPAPAPDREAYATPVISERDCTVREQRAARQAVLDADEQSARALAGAVAGGARFELSAEAVAPVCELVVAVRRVAARNGVHVPEPALADIIATCEDLASRNRRRGYSAMVPIGPLASCLYGAYKPSGADFGYPGYGSGQKNTYLRDVAAVLPPKHWERLAKLQHPGEELAAGRLDALNAADIRYQS